MREAMILGLLMAGSPAAWAQTNLVIQSFDASGQLTFTQVANAQHYRVEWAPGVAGPWTNFAAAAATLDMISPQGSNLVTASVPMLYRVVAIVTNPVIALPKITLTNVADVTTSFAPAGGSTWQVRGTIVNEGNDTWTQQSLTLDLPTGFAVAHPTTGTPNQIVIEGVTETCDAGCTGTNRTFDLSLTYTEAQSRTLSFRVTVPAEAITGLYDIGVRTTGNASQGAFEAGFPRLVTVPVGAVRTTKPVLDCPIIATDTSISGTSEPNAEIAVLFDLQQSESTIADGGGTWTVSSYPTTFGALFGGLEIRATAQAAGKLRSESSEPCIVRDVETETGQTL